MCVWCARAAVQLSFHFPSCHGLMQSPGHASKRTPRLRLASFASASVYSSRCLSTTTVNSASTTSDRQCQCSVSSPTIQRNDSSINYKSSKSHWDRHLFAPLIAPLSMHYQWKLAILSLSRLVTGAILLCHDEDAAVVVEQRTHRIASPLGDNLLSLACLPFGPPYRRPLLAPFLFLAR